MLIITRRFIFCVFYVVFVTLQIYKRLIMLEHYYRTLSLASVYLCELSEFTQIYRCKR